MTNLEFIKNMSATQLEKAILLATIAHSNLLDKAEKPYILHPLRVMMNVDKVRHMPIFIGVSDETFEKAKIVCVLHDVIEDTVWEIEHLREIGFDEDILQGVLSMTRLENETYSNFIARSMQNTLSHIAKLCDIIDNMDISRLDGCDEELIEEAEQRIAQRYLPNYHKLIGDNNETIIAAVKEASSQSFEPIATKDELGGFLDEYTSMFVDLTVEQERAIYSALENPVSVIQGTAGTGVMTTLNAVVACLEFAMPPAKVVVYSPSDRSRSNLPKSIRDNYIHKDDKVITADMLVIYQPQLAKRLELLDVLKRAKDVPILFVGDFRQLPTQEGIDFYDMAMLSGIPQASLTQNFHRQ